MGENQAASEPDYNYNRTYLLAARKGEKAEEIVFQILEEMKKEGLIRNCGRTSKFGIADKKDRDLFIYPIKGKEISLQVQYKFHESKKRRCERKKDVYYVALFKRQDEVEDQDEVEMAIKIRARIRIKIIEILKIAAEKEAEKKGRKKKGS